MVKRRGTERNAQALVKILDSLGFGTLGISEETFLSPNRILQLGHPPNRIDILTSITGVEFDEAWAHRVPSKPSSLPVHFIGRQELLTNKRASGRARDLGDLAQPEEIE